MSGTKFFGREIVKDKIFVCRKCQERVKKKDPEAKIEFEWNDETFKPFKTKAKESNNYKRLVLTSCLGPCPTNRISYQETEEGKLQKEKSYPIKFNEEQILKKLY